jgi:3-hydroxyisobutyrate dehydrogenase/2-hydroxy-3-oxopropionate reductase
MDSPDTAPIATIAVVGLGAMGGRMAERLLAAYDVVVWNRTDAKTRPLVDAGARVATSPAAAAAQADAVITMVSDPTGLRNVTEGPGGVLAGLGPESTLIEMSTVGPAAVTRLASLLPPGAGLLDAPVLGSIAEADAGTLRIFVGGPSRSVDHCRPVLSRLGTPIRVGPLGSGAAAKLVANATLFGVLGLLGEALALAQGLGLPRDVAFEVLSTTPLAEQARRRRTTLEAGDYPSRLRTVPGPQGRGPRRRRGPPRRCRSPPRRGCTNVVRGCRQRRPGRPRLHGRPWPHHRSLRRRPVRARGAMTVCRVARSAVVRGTPSGRLGV